MKVQVLAKGMEGQDNCRVRFLIFQSSAQVNGKAFVSGCAEVFEQNTVPLKIGAQHFWQGEDIMPVVDWSQDSGNEELGGGKDIFLMAGRAKPAAFAGESEQCIESTRGAMNACEAAFKVAAVQKFVDDGEKCLSRMALS